MWNNDLSVTKRNDMMTRTVSDKNQASLTAYSDALIELHQFVRLAWEGLGYGTQATLVKTTLREVSQEYKRMPEDQFSRALADAQRFEDFAKEQAKQGFRLLYYMATVQTWSISEAMVHDFAVEWLTALDVSQYPEKFSELQGPLIEFIKTAPDDRAEYLVGELERQLGASLKPGVSRFEAVLDNVGLGGPIAQSVRKSLLELQQMRNIIVHRSGRADRRFIEACPWVPCTTGEPIDLSEKEFQRYWWAAFWYLMELDRRQRAKLGQEDTDGFRKVIQLQRSFEKQVNELTQDKSEEEPLAE
jgi:hypothetical protein